MKAERFIFLRDAKENVVVAPDEGWMFSRLLVRNPGRCSLECTHSLDEVIAVFNNRIEKGFTFLLARSPRITVVTFRSDAKLIAPSRSPEDLVTASEHFDRHHR